MAAHNYVLLIMVIVLYCNVVSPKAVYGMEQKKSDEEIEKAVLPRYIRPSGFVRKERGPLYEINGPKMLDKVRSKVPIELDLLVENVEDEDRLKRYDDYGHMRFGKRGGDEQFDDYGHMRFGRST